MAMGISTPSGNFKPYFPSSFWFSSPTCRISEWTTTTTWMGSSSSPLASCYPKIYPRWDRHYLHCTSGPSSNTNKSSSINRFRKSSSYCYPSESCRRHVVSAIQSSSSSSSAEILLHKPCDENILSVPIHHPNYPEDRNKTVSKYEWVIERDRLHKTKANFRTKNCSVELALPENNFVEIMENEFIGSKDGSDYTKEGFSDSSSNFLNIKEHEQSQHVFQSRFQSSSPGGMSSVKGGGAETLLPTLLDMPNGSHVISSDKFNHNFTHAKNGASGKIKIPLERDTIDKSQLNGSNIGNSEAAENISADKAGNKIQKVKLKQINYRENLSCIYNEVLVINTVASAKEVVGLLTTKYRHLVHACDTEVAKIDVKQETPVDHGEIICFSIFSGSGVDFGNGTKCIWVDVLDGGGREILMEFAPFFEDSSIKKVWHNYSFDSHVIENYGIKVSGFHADTMHMARLWDSSRRTEGGYSLEALTSDFKVMNEAQSRINRDLIGKISMKTIFGKKKLKKDGHEGKIINIAAVEELQRMERRLWICYSALDSMSTLQLFESLESKLKNMDWVVDEKSKGTMYQFYEEYWRPFGELLVKMETEGMLVDRAHLAEIQKVATREQQIAANRFRNWAASYCPDAMHMNVGSDAQLRQLFFGGTQNSKDHNQFLPTERTFKVPNVDKVIEEGKKVPKKFRNITLCKLGSEIKTEMYTASGWPSVSGDALKTLAGKVSSEYDWIDPLVCTDVDDSPDQSIKEDVDISLYGTAYDAFKSNKNGEEAKGKEACHAIAALCDVCSIDSLISNFILPLQSSRISGMNKRIHCSLNINTETGRLSARRPNLQNQPALEKDRYKIRQAFIAAPGNSLIVADYGQLELRILAHLAQCKSMKEAFKAGGDFHSRTAMNMYSHIREAVARKEVLLEWYPQPGEDKPPVPLLKDAFASERRKAKMLNFSIAYGKTPVGLARDWKVSVKEARATVKLWYEDRKEVLKWQEKRKEEANRIGCVKTLLGRTRSFPSMNGASNAHKGHIERAAINTPVQGSAADVAMCAMLEISRNARLRELGWRLLLQVHDEVILEGPTESSEEAKAIVVECMSKPFDGKNILSVDLAVDAKCAQNWYAAK